MFKGGRGPGSTDHNRVVPAVTGAGDSVGVETGLRPVREIAEAGGPVGSRAGSPVMVGNRFLAVADVHTSFENREDDPPSDTPPTVKTRRRHEGSYIKEIIRQWDTEHRL